MLMISMYCISDTGKFVQTTCNSDIAYKPHLNSLFSLEAGINRKATQKSHHLHIYT